jgi:hypothetical protein
MRFKNLTYKGAVDAAIADATRLLKFDSKMLNDIFNKRDFKYDSGPSHLIANSLELIREPIDIYTYRPWYPSRAIGYFDGEAIHLNLRKLPALTHVDLVGNLLHEYAHYCGFHHGNNYKTEEKCLYSVPYFISENVGQWL